MPRQAADSHTQRNLQIIYYYKMLHFISVGELRYVFFLMKHRKVIYMCTLYLQLIPLQWSGPSVTD